MTRRCCRVDSYSGFLPLELVDGADSSAGQELLNGEDLRVVRSNDKNVAKGDRAFKAISINPSGLAVQYRLHESFDNAYFFG